MHAPFRIFVRIKMQADKNTKIREARKDFSGCVPERWCRLRSEACAVPGDATAGENPTPFVDVSYLSVVTSGFF
jgi:hypothetical protein